jgi:translation initiation factor IF-2
VLSQSDVTLANASDAIIIGFNVRPSMQAKNWLKMNRSNQDVLNHLQRH